VTRVQDEGDNRMTMTISIY